MVLLYNFACGFSPPHVPNHSRISPPHLGLFWGPVSQNRRRTSGWELESQIRRAPGRGETPRPLVWVQLGTALAPSVISLRSTIEVLTSIPREPGSRPPPPFNSAINNSSPSLSVPLSPLRCKLKAGCTPCFYANIRLVWTPAGPA